jgi:acyl carrier protein
MTMTTSQVVFAILDKHAHGVKLDAGMPLASTGLGLDSIALVEVLLECEERFGVGIGSEVLEQTPLTVGTLIETIDALRRA